MELPDQTSWRDAGRRSFFVLAYIALVSCAEVSSNKDYDLTGTAPQQISSAQFTTRSTATLDHDGVLCSIVNDGPGSFTLLSYRLSMLRPDGAPPDLGEWTYGCAQGCTLTPGGIVTIDHPLDSSQLGSLWACEPATVLADGQVVAPAPGRRNVTPSISPPQHTTSPPPTQSPPPPETVTRGPGCDDFPDLCGD